ncbi:MAG: tetratricopeptide repeat protein [Spirochaetales bacterium]|nr:tetratricopeptide repeat protein [Leptospiraceae bacterium]MCP5483512.1 tetratricopeptide repeat protein [Spirochaetales bacterium]MCP5486736.1 tetratricopeptide repeat protein [Spirochaetales bacterium]
MSEAKKFYAKALEAERAGDYASALRLYRSSARADPSFRPAFMNLGAMYSRARRPETALGFFTKALQLGEDAAVFFNLGSEAYKLERLEEAERFLKQALRQDVRLLKAHILLGYLYKRQNKNDKAEIYYQNALKIEPGNRMAVLGYAVMLSETHRYAEALAVVDRSISSGPVDNVLQNLRAGLLLKLGRGEESLQAYQELSASSPRFTSFTDHLDQARREAGEEHDRIFGGMDDRIRERANRLRERLKKRQSIMKGGELDASAHRNGIEGAEDLEEELKDDLRDMVDLSLLYLFKGDRDRALKMLFQARKWKEGAGEGPGSGPGKPPEKG